MPGAFVSVHLESPVPNALSICEAFVYTDQALPVERCPTFRDQPPGALASYNGKCYIFYNRQPLNFRDAQSFCRNRGGTLINESNPALQGFITLNFICQHQPKTCGRPEQPPNSTMIVPKAKSFEVGAQIRYACDPGHLLVGPSVRTCLETGFYNEFPP
uniref:Sushi domain-containing protein n=1 Tax=Megaselia scalaris TaxID=36166 RepID=T1GUX1_MEGSC